MSEDSLVELCPPTTLAQNTASNDVPDPAESYRKYVEKVAQASDGREVIQNKTEAHASIILSTLFRTAKTTVQIICDKLADFAYGVDEVVEAASAFIKNGGKVTIILECPEAYSQSKFLNALRDRHLIEKIDIYVVNPEFTSRYNFHFLLADGRHYRYQRRREAFAASAQFGADAPTAKPGSDLQFFAPAYARLMKNSKKMKSQ